MGRWGDDVVAVAGIDGELGVGGEVIEVLDVGEPDRVFDGDAESVLKEDSVAGADWDGSRLSVGSGNSWKPSSILSRK